MNLKTIEVKVDDHSAEVLEAFRNAVLRGGMAIGEKAVTHTKDNIERKNIVDTGRLLNSITYMVKEE